MSKRRPRGTGHLFRPSKILGDGTRHEQAVWWVAYRVGGKLVRESAGTTAKTEAERLLRARTSAVDTGQITAATSSTSLADLETLVTTDYKNNGRRSTRKVASAFAQLHKFFGKERRAREIDVAAVEAYKSNRKAEEAKNATINRELAALRRGFRLAVKGGRLAVRPDFSLLAENNARQGFFEADQFEAVRKELATWLKPVATFLYWTGWRGGEVLKLQWRQVDRKAGVIRIEDTDTKNRSARTIPYAVLPPLKETIEGQWKATEELRKKGAIVPWVFHRNGRPIRSFLTGWHLACARAGQAGRIPHDFRRTAARNMLRAGIPQRVAMEIGGWKTDSVFRRYAITDENLLAENLKKLAQLS